VHWNASQDIKVHCLAGKFNNYAIDVTLPMPQNTDSTVNK